MDLKTTIFLHRNEWIVYADKVLLLSVDEIAEKVSLAISTVKTYCRKFADRLKSACEVFDRFYYKLKKTYSITNETGIDPKEKGKQWCYLFRFYNAQGELVCSKVGTTTRSVEQRLKEELRSKTYKDCTSATIDRIYDCGDLPAEGLESRIRAEYIKLYPQSFKKNDRFISVLFDLPAIDNIVAEYLAIS